MRSLVRASRRSTDVFDVAVPSEVSFTVEAGAYDRVGEAAGPAPMELMLASLVTCAGATIDEVLRKMRLPATALNVVADADRAESVPRVYTRISLEYHVAVEAPIERVVRAVDITERTCSASAMLMAATDVVARPIHVRSVEPEVTRSLRQRILRPHQSLEETVTPGEDAEGAVFMAAFDGEDVVGTVALLPEGDGEEPSIPAMRLRSMAVSEEQQGRGLGRVILDAVLDRAWSDGAARVWCNARTTAERFYAAAGFRTTSDVFGVEGIGPHVRMVIDRP